jgi:hypothetical protein
MKKPIIGAKKKASKARMAEVKKIPSRGLAPTEKAVMKKNAASEVKNIKPQGISRKVNFPETHYGDIIKGIDGDMTDVVQHMKNHGSNIRKAANANRNKRSSDVGPVKMQNKIKRLPDTVVKVQADAKKAKNEVSKIKPQGIKTRDVRNMNQSYMAVAVEDGDADYFRKEAKIASNAAKKGPARKSMLSPAKTVKLAVKKARVKNAESRVANLKKKKK